MKTEQEKSIEAFMDVTPEQQVSQFSPQEVYELREILSKSRTTGFNALAGLGFNSKAKMWKNSAQTLNDGVWSQVQLDSSKFDNIGELDVATNYRFTAKSDGYYFCIGQVYFSSGLPIGSFISCQFYDGTNTRALAAATTGATNEASAVCSDIIYLSAGQYLQFHAVQVSGGNRALKVGGEFYNYATFHKIS